MRGLTYKSSGVDRERADAFKKRLKEIAHSSCGPEVLRGLGGFGGFFELARHKFKEPVLVSSADGVGTKLKIAILADIHDSVGIDAVAMNVNDILCTGARPLFFLDYIAYSWLRDDVLLKIVAGVNRGCIEAGCALVGGETAQMPGMYKKGEYDLAGFCVGVVEKQNIITGSDIEPGNIVVGLASSGLHSNGFSLVRKVFGVRELQRMSKELLRPTRIYVKPVVSLLDDKGISKKRAIRGIAHITGGAFFDKIKRIIPDNVDVEIAKDSWPVPEIFKLIQNKGGVSDFEMYHTFNMGVGMVLIASCGKEKEIISYFSKSGLKAWVIGRVVSGKGRVVIK